MLRLENIVKIYKSKSVNVTALKGVSMNFRKNEFVSILGPSGCGKTTTLNIIGGLDHYDDGDLIINGKSTKQYADRDWDVYRNHKIGFIFQSYNLIPHQTILENVELALTIAGIGKEERARRAKEALDNVGLKDMYNKHPNQLSGGQCQRVAIARALVNEPDILLADEPTGALDSVTSVQIMDLIKRISKEKLVIMVTHNPDLAQKYSTRIISLLDGEVESDSNPYTTEEEEAERAVTKSEAPSIQEKAKMSWWTAFKLSARNLWSKVRRTSLIVVASSIGIVGTSAVLALSQGVNGYIAGMQDDMLSGNPIEISESGFSLASLMSLASHSTQMSAIKSSIKDGKIDIQFLVETLIKADDTFDSTLVSNEITPEYEKFIDDLPEEYYAAIAKEYGVNVKNNLYTQCDVKLRGHQPDDLYSISGITNFCQNMLDVIEDGQFAAYSSMVDEFSNAIGQCLDNEEYVLSQYDVVAGKYATEEDEMIVVLNHRNQISEFILTLVGLYSQDYFTNAAYHFTDNPKFDAAMWEKQQQIGLDDFLSKEYYYYPNETVFTKNPGYGKNYIEDVTCYQPYLYDYLAQDDWTNGMKMKIVGVLAPKETTSYGCLSNGLYYTPKFAARFIKDNLKSEIATFIDDFVTNGDSQKINGYTSMVLRQKIGDQSVTLINGLGYDYGFFFEDQLYKGYGLVGLQNGLSNLISSMGGGGGSGGAGAGSGLSILRTATLTLRDVGGLDYPSSIMIYPMNFESKYLVTDYLNKWGKGDIQLSNGETILVADQTDIDYTDNLEVVISVITGVVDIVTIALICFTALSLLVSTVMIGIITYVSVMERIKEIGVIRSLGGRKSDVSHLFNAETFMIGIGSGAFGLLITYFMELILNLTLGVSFNLGMIANLHWWTALIILVVAVVLTMIAGLIPSLEAAKQDPVNALRSE
ncbi:MAG: ATP-binding cassette domain-containing protein [Candidatus Enteromonas sp.]